MSVPHVIFTNVETGKQYHSYEDFGLILSGQDIEVPAVKTNKIDIPGAHGSLDLTEVFGRPYYENRELSFTFNIVAGGAYAWDEIRTVVANRLHSKKVEIQIWSDSKYKYTGRCFVDKYSSSKGLGTIVIKCDCDPFKEGNAIIRTLDENNQFIVDATDVAKKIIVNSTNAFGVQVVGNIMHWRDVEPYTITKILENGIYTLKVIGLPIAEYEIIESEILI